MTKTHKIIGGLIILLCLWAVFSANAYTVEESYGSSVLFPYQGGTGTGTPPVYGQMLVGNPDGTYTLTATSSLGIVSTGGGGTTTVDSLILAEGYLIVGDASGYGSATSSLFIDAQGNIGIATATPAYTLDIYGDLRVTDSLTVTGQTTLAHASSTMLTVSGGIYGDLIGDVTGTASGNDVLGQAASTLLSHTTTYNHANYDTAYGWGDHSVAGYNLQSFASSTYAIAGGAFHDGFSDFVANEHTDWRLTTQGTIHATNYVDNNTTYTSSDFTLSDISGSVTDGQVPNDITITNLSGTNTGDVSLAGTPNYLTLSGQEITQTVLDIIDDTDLVDGTNLTFSGSTLNVDDAFIKNNASDIMAGTLTADGLTLGANENLTLGAKTLDHDGTDFNFNDSVDINDGTHGVRIIPGTSTTTISFY